MKLIPCNTCNSTNFSDVLRKESSQSEEFTVVKCKSCGLVQVNPQPEFEEVLKVINNPLDIDYPNFECQDEKLLNPSNWQV